MLHAPSFAKHPVDGARLPCKRRRGRRLEQLVLGGDAFDELGHGFWIGEFDKIGYTLSKEYQAVFRGLAVCFSNNCHSTQLGILVEIYTEHYDPLFGFKRDIQQTIKFVPFMISLLESFFTAWRGRRGWVPHRV